MYWNIRPTAESPAPESDLVPFNFNKCLVVLAAVLCALALSSRAQESSPDADDSDGEHARTASLSLSFDAYGASDVSLDLDRPPDPWDTLQLDLTQALHCPAAQFGQNPQNYDFDEKYSARLSPELESCVPPADAGIQ
jgi:hypothetical protein